MYEAHDRHGSRQTEGTIHDAADAGIQCARDVINDPGYFDDADAGRVLVEIGRPVLLAVDHDDGWPGFKFEQTAAAVPVSTMRRALALAEQHDADLAAELRASLVSP